MVETAPKPKRDIEVLIDKLKKGKKKPEDWVFVPRPKHHENASVMLEDGEYALIADGGGGFKSHTKRRPLKIKIGKVKGVGPNGELYGGFRPAAMADWTAQEVLEELIALSLNPECAVVPYEAREMGKEAKDAQHELLSERKLRLEAEDKLRALEDADAKKDARIRELEKLAEEYTKPKK